MAEFEYQNNEAFNRGGQPVRPGADDDSIVGALAHDGASDVPPSAEAGAEMTAVSSASGWAVSV